VRVSLRETERDKDDLTGRNIFFLEGGGMNNGYRGNRHREIVR
jgi:hypothetical protein